MCKGYSGYCLFLAGASHRLKSSAAAPREAFGDQQCSPPSPAALWISVFMNLKAAGQMQNAFSPKKSFGDLTDL